MAIKPYPVNSTRKKNKNAITTNDNKDIIASLVLKK